MNACAHRHEESQWVTVRAHSANTFDNTERIDQFGIFTFLKVTFCKMVSYHNSVHVEVDRVPFIIRICPIGNRILEVIEQKLLTIKDIA